MPELSKHIFDLFFLLSAYLFVGLSLLGWGRLLAKVVGFDSSSIKCTFCHIWLGFCAVLLIFQSLSLLFPLNWLVSILVYGVGLILAFRWLQMLRQESQRLDLNSILPYFIFMSIVVVLIASRSMLAPSNGDSGLYHFNCVKWINSYPAVPGLANLHGRFGYNPSFFVYVASLNFFPYFPHGHNVANSLLLLTLMSQVSWRIWSVLKLRLRLFCLNPLVWLPHVLVLPVLIYYPVRWEWLSSPTPDLTSILIQLCLFLFLLDIISDSGTEPCKGLEIFTAVTLSICAVTIKLSNLGYSVAIIGISAWFLYFSHSKDNFGLKHFIRVFAPGVLIMMVWIVRGYINSGYPLFPSTFGRISFDWTVPIQIAVNEANWIHSWARLPGVHWREVIGNWNWLGPWIHSLSNDAELIAYPVLCGLAQLVVLVVIRFKDFLSGNNQPQVRYSVILIPSICGILFWFFTAPGTRFANALFWIFSMSASVLLLSYVHQLVSKRAFATVACILLIAVNLGYVIFPALKFFDRYSLLAVVQNKGMDGLKPSHLVGSQVSAAVSKSLFQEPNRDTQNVRNSTSKRIFGLSLSGFHEIPRAKLIEKQTNHGLKLLVPEDPEDTCWDSDLPSTQYFKVNLQLRKPGNLGSGFRAVDITGP